MHPYKSRHLVLMTRHSTTSTPIIKPAPSILTPTSRPISFFHLPPDQCISNAMKLLDLPFDIINLFPIYFHSITDLYALLSTCRTLYNAFAFSSVRLPPILPRLYGRPLLPPHPHL